MHESSLLPNMDPMTTSHSRMRDKLFFGWLVVFALFIISIIAFGTRFSFGVFFKALTNEFGLTRAETSGVYSAYMLICSVFAVVSGWGVDKFSPRTLFSLMGLFIGLSLVLTSQAQSLGQLFFVYSVLLAMGTGGAYGVTVSTIIRWFDKKRGLAIGLATSGAGLGTVIMAPFATYLISRFGWRTSFIVMGIIAWLFVIPMAMLLKRDPGQVGLLPYGVKPNGANIGEPNLRESSHQRTGFSVSHAFKIRNFWCLSFSWLLTPLAIYVVLTHLVPHGTDMGIPAMKAATFLSLIGAMNIPGRLFVGRISDSAGRKATAVVCAGFLAGAIVWLTYSKDLWMFYLFAVVFGFSFGGISTSTAAMIGDVFGLHSIGVIMGIMSAAWALGAAIGPFMGGLIYDITNSYSLAFSISTAAMIVVTLLLVLTKRETKPNR
jgi:OFA family oxalate/formate antiporter-like MFS transporter